MKRILFLPAILILSGCATPKAWFKDGASQQDFNTDKYQCDKDARQSGYYGTGWVGMANMNNFFSECMNSKGWYLREIPRNR